MRFAGTIRQYSSRAMDQLATMAIQSGELRCCRRPYHAKVMKTLDIDNRAKVPIINSPAM